MNRHRHMTGSHTRHRIAALALAVVLLGLSTVVSEAMARRNTMQETRIVFSLAGKVLEVDAAHSCFKGIGNQAVVLLETSDDTFDTKVNPRQIAEWKGEKDWLEVDFVGEKTLRIGYLKQSAAVGTILIFFRKGRPDYIVWGRKGLFPEQAQVAANTMADRGLHDTLTKCGR